MSNNKYRLDNKGPRCGYISILGKPNVGKSSLINQLAQTKKVMTSKRAQTTIFNTTCILTFDDLQMQCILVDTPGINFDKNTPIKKSINQQAMRALSSIDLKVWVIDPQLWNEGDEKILSLLKGHQDNTLVVINKIDKVTDKATLLPLISTLSDNGFNKVLPHSAHSDKYRDRFLDEIYQLLPMQEYFFSEKEKVMASVDFQVREVVREKCLRYLGQELPYLIAVSVEKNFKKNKVLHLYVRLDCSTENHKKMIIGTGGELLKQISTSSRILLESLLKQKIFLRIWVKTRDERRNQATLLSQFECEQ